MATADFINIQKNNEPVIYSADDNWMLIAVGKNGDIRWTDNSSELMSFFINALYQNVPSENTPGFNTDVN